MDKKILSFVAVIPALIVGVSQNFVDSGGINTSNLNVILLPQKSVLTSFHIPQSLPFILAARDGKEEECHWLGTCKDND